MLGQCRSRWANIKKALGQRLVFIEKWLSYEYMGLITQKIGWTYRNL